MDAILNEYFDFLIDITKDPVKIKVKLKDSKKCKSTFPITPKGVPYSGVTKEYYLHFLENETIALDVWCARKTLCAKTKLIDWCITNLSLGDDICDKLVKCKTDISLKLSKSLNSHYASESGESTRKKLRARSKQWAPIIGKKNSDLWKSDEYRTQEIERRFSSGQYDRAKESNRVWMSDPENHKKFVESCNSPTRKKKISDSTKQRWQEWVRYNPDMVRKIVYSSRNKQFEIQGIKMNKIEFEVANYLSSINIVWKYEEVFNIDNQTYIPDFYLPEQNTVIECYGDYWHANPNIFNETTTVFRTPVLEIHERDFRRKIFFESNGMTFISLWETDILKNFETIKQQLWKILLKKK